MRKYGCSISRKREINESDPLILKRGVLKSIIDLRKAYKMPTIINQGNLGSCTGCAFAYMFNYIEIKQMNKLIIKPSPLYIYYNERVLRDTINYDSGAEIYDGIVAIRNHGVCDITRWPYNAQKFKIKPSIQSYAQGKLFKSVTSSNINQNIDDLKNVLNNNLIFVFGFLVYESFETINVEKTGMVPFPDINNEKILGGHAVVCVGYDDKKRSLEGVDGMFICANSWGTKWGEGGYFYFPYSYMTNSELAGDFWTISAVTNPKTLMIDNTKLNRNIHALPYKSRGR